jgi:CheY-like chemotaxis protein
VGGGTTFTMYFPRAGDPAARGESSPDPSPTFKGTETILVVEDDASVRELVSRVLEEAGYRVLLAGAPAEALSLVAGLEEPLHLLLTDVVMPGLNGRALADHLLRLRPSLRVLFVSGYAQSAIVREGVLEAGVDFLPKPFTPVTLRARVREILDRPAD